MLGSKEKEWKWCCNCAKCLFVYTILSPFIDEEELVDIFGENLFEKIELLETFLELAGETNIKPFECVGTFEEVKYAISKTIGKLQEEGKKLPCLLEHYHKNYILADAKNELMQEYNEFNNIPEELKEYIEKGIEDVRKFN